MQNKLQLHFATTEDRTELEALRFSYISFLYQGFDLPVSLSKALAAIGSTEAADRKTLVCESNGVKQGYMTICSDPAEPGCGLVEDFGLLPNCDVDVRYLMLETAINSLRQSGLGQINVRILRDNFRVRFLFEQFGFRCSHAIHSADEELDGRFLQYILPAGKSIHP